MKLLIDCMIEESVSERKFGCLSEMHTKSLVHLGALTPESFSERMIINANLLVDSTSLKFGDDMIDKIIALRMNKKFMDRMHSTKTYATMNFDHVNSTARNKV